MKGLLLAGGHGTRLRPLTFSGNKHMIPIANKPMLLYGLEHLRSAGIKEIGIILGPIKEGVREKIGDGSKYGVDVTYIEQPDPRGLAHAVLVSEDFLGKDSFVMYLGDNLLKNGLKDHVDLFHRTKSDCVVSTIQVKNPSRYGVIKFNDNGSVTRFVEKPKEFISDWALIGVYIFNRHVFDAVKKIKPSWRNELEITDTIQQLLDDGKKISVKKVEGWWKDTGKPDDLLEANRLILKDLKNEIAGNIESNVKISEPISIGKNTTIREGSTLIGPLIIGEDCVIGPRTYIGPYTSIGDRCKIVKSDIHNSIVMEDTDIECNILINDSIIGRNVNIFNDSQVFPEGCRFILGDQSKVTL
jgi:glucose-1-phosphate thymidylyltransferase